ncbi:hypothetical protein [Desulfurella multipotens]|nr:hypothetical protein [Desulfurella multipotens]
MYKVLFHIELDAIEPLKVAIGNINNLLLRLLTVLQNFMLIIIMCLLEN